MMKSLLCPISDKRIEENVVRITGFLVVTALFLSMVFNWTIFLWIVVVDYWIRAFTKLSFSPFSRMAKYLSRQFGLNPKTIDKAPKIFAARIGFLFASTGLLISFLDPLAGISILSVLLFFALLESVGNICMGCLVYSYVILKIFK